MVRCLLRTDNLQPPRQFPMFDLESLNPQQRAAVIHRDGPLLLLAGAGSGKTRVLTCRVAHLLQQGVAARAILAVTFTNKAAREMRERVEQMVGREAARGMLIATFHAFCLQVLKAHIDRLGFKKNFSIYAAADQQRLIRDLLRDIDREQGASEADQIQARISAAKNRMIAADAYRADPRDPYAPLVEQLYPRYQKALKAFNALDFDDLLLLTAQLLEQSDDLLERYRQRFQYLMVDEYQDTNPVQYHLLRLLAGRQGNLCVVGDDDQSIYAFRGAAVDHILDFTDHFPGTRVIKLEQNYRSSGRILAVANAIIKHNSRRREKTLWTAAGDGAAVEYLLCADAEDEARRICERILAEQYRSGRRYGDFAILYRTNSQSRAFEEQLRYANVPYVLIGGQQFYDRKEIKDVVAYLKTLRNPRDEVSLLRILNYPRRGIGENSIDNLIRYSAQQETPLWEVLRNAARLELVNPKTAAAIDGFVDLLERYRVRLREASRLLETLRELFEELRLAETIYQEEKDPRIARRRVDNQQEILNSLATYLERTPDPDLSGFLERISLLDEEPAEAPDKEAQLTVDAVTLMSLHSSKGLEFPVVFLAGLEEGFLPHRKSRQEDCNIDEERRLCYVGITRARQQLILSGARQRRKFGKLEEREVSRFIAEIPTELLTIVREESVPPSSPEQAAASASQFFANINQLLGD